MNSSSKGDHIAMRTRMYITASVLVGLLAFAGPAAAQSSPTQDAYGGVIAEVVTPSKPTTSTPPASQPTQQVQAQQTASAPAAQPSGSLPFTGLQVTLVLLAGALLLGGGVVLRRATTS